MAYRQLRLGIFGVGRMGLVHLENLLALAAREEIHLVALGDRHAATLVHAENFVAEQGNRSIVGAIATFDSPVTMAREVALDAVVVASRTEHHAADSRVFTDQKIAVLLEKPLASCVSEAVDYCNALGADGHRLVQLAFQRHHDPAARAASHWLATGRIGKLQQSHHVLQDKNPTPANYQSSGITADMAIHLIFEAMSFHGFELPRQVQAIRFMAPHYEDRANEGANVVHAFCRWADGSPAHLWGSRINNTGYDNGFKLIGTGGRIDVGEFVGDFGDVSAKMWQGAGEGSMARGVLVESLRFPMSQPSPGHPDFYPRYATAYLAELTAFIEGVRQREALEPGPDIGWKTQLVAELAELSSRSEGRQIELALADGSGIRTAAEAASFFAAISAA